MAEKAKKAAPKAKDAKAADKKVDAKAKALKYYSGMRLVGRC